MFDTCLQMSDINLPVVSYVADAVGEEDKFVRNGLWHQLDYSKVCSLLSVSITTFDDAAPFFTAWRVFQSKVLT